MSFDRNAKRYWPFIVCAMIGIAAYFQASAIASLVSASLGGEPYVPPAAAASTEGAPDPEETASPILDRNPFDSSTGKIDAPVADEEHDEIDDSAGVSSCSTGRVVLIAENEDPNWAFASIDDGSGEPKLRRVGDTFGRYRVESLSWDRVYLLEDGRRCFLAMGGSISGVGSGAASGDSKERARARGEDSNIEQISETEFTMSRATMDAILGTPGGLLGETRITPEKLNDSVIGLRLGYVRTDTPLQRLGLKTSDVLQSMSGTQITSPEKLIEAYERMQSSDIIRIKILRQGAPKQIELRVR